jgi:hypothetical protein
MNNNEEIEIILGIRSIRDIAKLADGFVEVVYESPDDGVKHRHDCILNDLHITQQAAPSV